MKNSLKKLRGLALHHRQGDHHKEHMDLRPLRQSDEISRASQDMEDMRDCYDSLLSAAAATANSAYEFSESLREMGACLLEKTALNDDEESGKVLLMLGKVQFELQKLVDSYRSHIFQTITIPSESLLNELRTVEEMKHQCDEKREIYEFIRTRLRDKGRGRSGKGESVSVQHLQAAHDEYDDEAALFVFRLKSLKQGQSRSLLTQAARHHAAQLCFFKKALKSLEAVEPHVKSVTEQQHIDYNFTGIEDYDGDNGADDYNDDYNDDDDDDDTPDDGELSFDYRQNDQENIVTTSGNSMDVDMTDITFPSIAPVETSKENIEGSYRKSFSYRGEIRAGSQSAPLFADNKSAPLFADNKSTPADKLKQMRPSSTRKFNSYVLPTPLDAQNPNLTASGGLVPRTLKTSLSGRPDNLWHSSPLDPKKYNKFVDDKLSGPTVINVHSVLRESNNNLTSTQLPPPLADGLFASRPDPLGASDYKKIKRYAFSGPISGKPWPSKQISVEQPQLFSGPLLQNSRGLSSSPPQVSPKLSPKASPSASPKFMSSPKISELHELPRPPANSTSKSSKPVSLVGHSAPLMPKANVLPTTSKSLVPKAASPLPTPSQVVTRSYSIPSSGLRAMALNVSKPLEAIRNAEITESVASPPLTPIALSDTQKLQSGPEAVNRTVHIRDVD